MEALYTINKAQFHQVATHVSVYHEDCSPGYSALVTDCMLKAGLRPERMKLWNVPDMSSLLGKAIPLDVHGNYVLVDEAKALESSKSYGVLRYALLSAAVRSKEGGKRRYDFLTMNASLMMGAGAGFGFLSYGRRRWGWMRRRPYATVFGSFAVALAGVALSRLAIRTVGVGLIMAERSHKKALQHLDCLDCIDDVNTYTAMQIEELKQQKVPQQPGMPPPPEDFIRKFEKGIQAQVKLLEIDMLEVGILRKKMTSHVCSLHKGLREAPDTYADPLGLPILPTERAAATSRPALKEGP
mmetsp:Transcript_26091/g.30244  ORF Transcript_26091/g.30244 Transcript_26091/m.30244 type:complete len:298 (+) Transcript_26091:54-947(+)